MRRVGGSRRKTRRGKTLGDKLQLLSTLSPAHVRAIDILVDAVLAQLIVQVPPKYLADRLLH